MMKRFLPLLPVLLFLYTSSCDSGIVSIAEGTAVAHTQTASIWTPSFTAIPDPNKSEIVDWLNETLIIPDNDLERLEQTLDVTYRVTEIEFSLIPYNSNNYYSFQVHVRCECATNPQCCIPERMFVLVIGAMENHQKEILAQVSDAVSELRVVCYDRFGRIGDRVALWSDVKDYLLDKTHGYELGAHVTRVP